MTVHEIDPWTDVRWRAHVDGHRQATVFHTPEWLEALRRTYAYVPHVLTTTPPGGRLTDGLPVCRVDSWLTGSRLVSIPFSDHCDPLLGLNDDGHALFERLADNATGRLRYAEVRPRFPLGLANPGRYRKGDSFTLHTLDLAPSLDNLHARLHQSSVQRKIRRARRERLELTDGRDESHLRQFYQLLLMTRRRHGIPPQPLAWFCNLADLFDDRLTVRIASHEGRPVAGILTMHHRDTVVYKYGASDARFHRMGGMPLLFWEAIRDAKTRHFRYLDLGRSAPSNTGLVRFKDSLGADRVELTYWRAGRHAKTPARTSPSALSRRLLVRLPDPLFKLAGHILYRHAA